MIQVRYVKADDDASALCAIHNHYVDTSSITFDERHRTLDEQLAFLSRYAESGPYRCLVAVDNGAVIGSASSNRYRDHPAFRSTIESSIYLHPGSRGLGVGAELYRQLFHVLKDEDLHRVVSGIALPNVASVKLHEKFGFTSVGVFQEYAIKNGLYVSSLWMQKSLPKDGLYPHG